MSIEYDGFCQGYSCDFEYITMDYESIRQGDPHRISRINNKINVCKYLNYPIAIIADPEMMEYSYNDSKFSILDSIIGQVYAFNQSKEAIIHEYGEYIDTENILHEMDNISHIRSYGYPHKAGQIAIDRVR